MDWSALSISLKLAFWTSVLLLPLGLVLGRWLAWYPPRAAAWVHSLIFLPLVLPPTVLGYYALLAIAPDAPLGMLWQSLSGRSLAFSFEALLLVSLVANLPFVVQPICNSYQALDRDIYDAGRVCGLAPWSLFWRIELPLIWPGVLSATMLTFTHTLGEFGVVLMVGGNLAGETRTLSIAIYDEVQALNMSAAGQMSLFLLLLAFSALLWMQWQNRRARRLML